MVLSQEDFPPTLDRKEWEGDVDSREEDMTVVEGYVFEHALLWKSKSNSVGGYLNLDGGNQQQEVPAAQHPQLQQQQQPGPPRVSVTLSEYLSAGSPNPDPSCDFGWFTPTASVSSLLSAGDVATTSYMLEDQEPVYRAPSPAHHPTNFLFARNTSSASAAKTVTLSPESVLGCGGGDGGGGNKSNRRVSYTTTASEGECSNGSIPTQESASLSQKQRSLQLVLAADASNGNSRGNGSYRRGSTGCGGAGVRGSAVDDGVPDGRSNTTMGVRLLPVACSRSTTTHLNSWHTLYSEASESGNLSSHGKATLHLKRAGYLISTRHFPEKSPMPLAPRSTGEAAGISASGGGGGVGGPVGRRRSATPFSCSSAVQHAQEMHRAHLRRQEQQQQQQPRIKPKSYSWSITEIRVRQGQPFQPPFAQYLVVVCVGREKLVAGWRRTSEFEKLAQVARAVKMSKVQREYFCMMLCAK